MTAHEFASKIKAKYPAYANVDDYTLAEKMVAKYPVYARQVDITKPKPITETTTTLVPDASTSFEKYTDPLKRAGERFKRVLAPTVLGRKTGLESIAGIPERLVRTAEAAAVSAVDIPLSYAMSGAKEIAQAAAPKPVETAVAEAGEAAGETLKEFYGGKAKKLIGAMPVAVKDWLKEQYGDAAYNANWSAILGLATLGGIGRGASAAKSFLTAEKTLAPEAKQAFVDLIERTSLDDIPEGEAKNLIKIIRGKNNTLAIEAPKSPIVTESAPLGAAQQGVMREPGMVEKTVWNPATGKNEFRLVPEAPEAEAAIAKQKAEQATAKQRLERSRMQAIATGEKPPLATEIPDKPSGETINSILDAVISGTRKTPLAPIAGGVVANKGSVDITEQGIKKVWDEYVSAGGEPFAWASPGRFQGPLSKVPEAIKVPWYAQVLKKAQVLDKNRAMKLTIDDLVKLNEHMDGSGVSMTGNFEFDGIIDVTSRALDDMQKAFATGAEPKTILEKTANAMDAYLKVRRIWGQTGQALQQYAQRTGNKQALDLYNKLSKKLAKNNPLDNAADQILRDLSMVDPNNPKVVQDFFSKHMSSFDKMWDGINTFRYANMLSSPVTHLVNMTGTLVGITAPAFTRLGEAAADAAGEAIYKAAGKAYKRDRFFAEVPAQFVGTFFDKNSWKAAATAAKDALAGSRGYAPEIEPFWKTIPDEAERKAARNRYIRYAKSQRTGIKKIMTIGEAIPSALEAADMFFRELAKGGEYAALDVRNLKGRMGLSEADLRIVAEEKALQRVYRQKFMPESQGQIFDGIDKLAQGIMGWRHGKPAQQMVAGLLFPFVTTPTNIFKRGIEWTPIGMLDTGLAIRKYKISKKGLADFAKKIEEMPPELRQDAIDKAIQQGLILARNKDELREKVSRGVTGSLALVYLGMKGARGEVTWSYPDDPKAKAAWIAEGKKPYSIKVSDAGGEEIWMPYNATGELGIPISIVAAYQHYLRKYSNDKKAQENLANNMKSYLSAAALGPLDYFSHQSLIQTIGITADIIRGKESPNKMGGQLATQAVPASSALNWITGMMDEFARKPEVWYEYIQQRIPGLSEGVRPWPGNQLGIGSAMDEFGRINPKITYEGAKKRLAFGGVLGGLVTKTDKNRFLMRDKLPAGLSEERATDAYYGKPGSEVRKIFDELNKSTALESGR